MKTQIPDFLGGVGEGWWKILQALHDGLTRESPNYQASQVKEKFGGLRVYLVTYPTDEMARLIVEAEDWAATTCESCGEPGSLRTDRRWRKTLCDACNKPEGE